MKIFLCRNCLYCRRGLGKSGKHEQERRWAHAQYGIVPSLRTLIKAADVFEVPIMYLLGEGERDFIPSASPSTFHCRIAELAKEKGVKYSDISHQMSFAPNSIYEWLREETLPSVDHLVELAAYFYVSCDHLLGRTDHKK